MANAFFCKYMTLMDQGWYLMRNRRFRTQMLSFFHGRMGYQGTGVILRINSSTIGMESARSYTCVTKKSVSFTSRTYAGFLGRKEGSLTFNGMLSDKDEGKRTGKGNQKDAMLDMQNKYSMSGISRVSMRGEMDSYNRIRQQCIRYLMGLFSGNRQSASSSIWEGSSSAGGASISTTVFSTSISETYMEEENTSFQTTGSVVTADGRKIEFNLEMEMSRSFQSTYQQTYEMMYHNVQTCDPLVINLDGNVASVSDQKFLFDIDGDGVLDEISELSAGSGYLAIDKNGDGKINDGTELFGPQSGNGFADLAKYDDDGNGWIDEDDAIWEKLLIWTKDENGKDQLYHVSEKGIGAICLKNQSTDFSLNSMKDNQTNAFIRSTGIFLYENGTVGTVQHVDMAK